MLRGRGRGSFQSRGGSRGRGGRGRGTGAAAAAHKLPAAAAKRSAVPAFPVVSRGGDSTAAVTSSQPSSSPARSAGKSAPPASRSRSAHSADDGDDAPPVAVSARRGSAAAGDEEAGEGRRGFVPPSAVSLQRGRGRGRGGSERGGGLRGRGAVRGGRGVSGSSFASRGGSRGRGGNGGFTRQHREEADDNAEKEADVEVETDKHAGPTRVITTVTASGTELPKKLNTKVFIDGLPYNYAAEPGKPSLEDEVLQFAAAWKVGKPLRLIKKPGQGFGFLVLQSPNSVATAVRVLNGRKFLGRALRVEEPKPKDLEKMQDIGGMKDMGKDSFTRQVLLTDLAKVAQPEIIREVLRDVAPQLEKKLEAIKMTSQNRKAFLTFETEAEVGPAITFLDGFHLLGRRISAMRAAAPGSLPYSHGGAGPSPRAVAAAAAAAAVFPSAAKAGAAAGAEDDEEETAVVPLGMEPATPAPSSASRRRTADAASASASPAAAMGAGSNVTGRTDKYNLLDKGPKDVYVGNVGEDVTEAQLRQHFAPCGAIRSCEILVHPETHLSTGIAHIEFAVPAYAAYAQERYHGSRLRGCVLRVDRGETASVPLAAELPPAEAEDDYDEEAYMARYGVRDKKAYFKGTSMAAEMGADAAAEDEDSDSDIEDALTGRAKTAPKAKTAAGKRARTDAAAATKKAPEAKRRRSEAASATAKPIAAALADDSDDDEEERFFDVDTVAVSASGSAAGKKAGAGKKAARPTNGRAAKKAKK